MMAEISIVISVYNVKSEYFRQCMQSVLAQSFEDYEVIIVDDGSTNGVEKLCDRYADGDRRVQVIHQENRGVSEARNIGTERAAGKWIIYLDPDDWWENHTLGRLIRTLKERDPDVLVFSYYDNYEEDGTQYARSCWRTPHPLYTEADKKLMRNMQVGLMDESRRKLTGYFGSACMQISRLEFIRKNQLKFQSDLRKSEDMIYDLQLLEKVEKLGILDMAFYHYRHHPASACNRYTPDIEEIMESTIRALEGFCAEKDEEYGQALQYFMAKYYVDILRLKYFHKANPNRRGERLREWRKFLNRPYGSDKMKHTDIRILYGKRKIMAVFLFISFKIRSYSILRAVYKIYYAVKKE